MGGKCTKINPVLSPKIFYKKKPNTIFRLQTHHISLDKNLNRFLNNEQAIRKSN